MRILNRHIGMTVINSVLMTCLVLVGIESFLELASELKDVGNGNFHFFQAIATVLLALPTDLYELFPIAALVGGLIGLGRLANNSELVVMASAGVSRWQIIVAMLQVTLVMIIVMTLIGEGLAPKAQQYAKSAKLLALSGGKSLTTENGIWFRDGLNFIFIHEVVQGNNLHNITRYQFDDQHRLTAISHANEGAYQRDGWYFSQVVQSSISPTMVSSERFNKQKWDIKVDKRLLGITKASPDQMTLKKLYSYINYRHQNDLGSGAYDFIFWKRLVQPLATLVMIFLAVPFIFGPLRTVSMGLRIVIGVVVGFSFYILNQFFGPICQVYQIPAFMAAVIPTITFALLGTFLLFFKT